ncbi:transporter [Cypionkella aquatica]|uniref:Transporter n=1 Tax=Cypionkella aquatica TaxID=1756042 RepID=A0AA37WYR3_9RHOB|nr:ACT domain-containing protein [Cypionkella aquatica]GLS85608.1 transporter [Cypionkella aquatica]
MAGEADLAVLLRVMRPELHAQAYGYAVSDQAIAGAFAQICEAEGMTVIAEVAVLAAAGIAVLAHWARITLTVHSDLAAVGLTAAIARALAAEGISANVVAGFYHDHVLVPWERRGDAMAALRGLSDV